MEISRKYRTQFAFAKCFISQRIVSYLYITLTIINMYVFNIELIIVYAEDDYMHWLTLIILIFLVILCWYSIHQQYKYQPYT
ncbi:hypothetical protein KM472_gp017 [Cynomolgus macaque cytomegalovirus strain Ottawa]|uniref:Uncharacterized protein n=1 Tax=macacine betaherpesvirus 8 TaxID=2560567 RepID=G8H120_9BETA|nr:hypothetical protein KM472_gp017 [Cynomolgus macaque cytomegalovirus strain Ottawa]AEQ32094.1 hypothetical protein cy17 [Cynomolgus macaque cytomegalovirus strain Ottawa]